MKIVHTLTWASASVAALVGLLGCREFFREYYGRGPVYVEQREPEYVIVREAPPPFVSERRPPPRSQGQVWIDGYWNWNGRRYVWESGRWTAPPRAHAVWAAPRYEKHQKGYRYTPGHWRESEPQRQKEVEQHKDRH
ncbi:MAG TPA: YXWGXW repeat-containing protein [Planctomycetota bacterium]|nr:YXWGXW repeat-containing protein [Planctomycetota bacterium]